MNLSDWNVVQVKLDLRLLERRERERLSLEDELALPSSQYITHTYIHIHYARFVIKINDTTFLSLSLSLSLLIFPSIIQSHHHVSVVGFNGSINWNTFFFIGSTCATIKSNGKQSNEIYQCVKYINMWNISICEIYQYVKYVSKNMCSPCHKVLGLFITHQSRMRGSILQSFLCHGGLRSKICPSSGSQSKSYSV